MWDSLGSSVDINLDNLSPHSKGVKVNINNVPMKAMMTAGQSSGPMSPTNKLAMMGLSQESPTKTKQQQPNFNFK